MNILRATLYDGRTARAQEVSLRYDSRTWRISGTGTELEYSADQVRLSAPLGTTRRVLSLPDGGLCEFTEGQDLSALPTEVVGSTHLHRVEQNWNLVVSAILLTATLIWTAVAYGIPRLAEKVAFHLPFGITRQIGEQALAALDQSVFQPSQLPVNQASALQARFRTMLGLVPSGRGYRLTFRNAPHIGANAFALPSGTVVVTDDLVKLTQNDNELLAVLAHELGHLEHRHSLRALLQSSVTGLVILAITGDASSILALGTTSLIHGKYSREFEMEADDFALQYLQRGGIPTHHFADILTRMVRQKPSESQLIAFLASHPQPEDRIRRFQDPQHTRTP